MESNRDDEGALSAEDFLDFMCPHCGEPTSFPKGDAGLLRDCPNCTETLIVPKSSGEAGRKLPFPITTPRLVLRRLRDDDWKDLLKLFSDEELFEHTAWQIMDEQQIFAWLKEDTLARLTAANQGSYLGIQALDSGQLIGLLEVALRSEDKRELWFDILVTRPYQRNGVASEVLGALFDFSFDEISVRRIITSIDSRNVAAAGLLAKMGMRREGEAVKDQKVKGEWINTVSFALLEEEYQPKA